MQNNIRKMKIEVSDLKKSEFEVLLSGRASKRFLVSAVDKVQAKMLALAKARGDSSLDEAFINSMEVESIIKQERLKKNKE